MAYLMVAERQYEDKSLQGNYNVGPDEKDCLTTGELASLFGNQWNEAMRTATTWENRSDYDPHEANLLKLDCSKMKGIFDWKPQWNVSTAMHKIIEWNHEYLSGGSVLDCMDRQIGEFENSTGEY